MSNKTPLDELYASLQEAGFTEGTMNNGVLRTTPPPFNVFARLGAGLMDQPANEKVGWLGTKAENEKLGPKFGERFMVACNRCVA